MIGRCAATVSRRDDEAEQFRYAFAHVMTEPDARSAYDNDVVPGPGRPIFEVPLGNFSLHAANKVGHRNNKRARLLLIAGAEDHLVPAVGTG